MATVPHFALAKLKQLQWH